MKCAKCGSVHRWTIVVALAVLAIFLIALIGCGNSGTITQENSAPQESAPAYTSPPPPQQPPEIPWNQAASHINENQTVVGPVVGTRWATSSNGQPKFLNVGTDYPSPNRFTVLIWNENQGNFPSPPEAMYAGQTIAVTGLISTYQGVAQIEVSSPSQIQIR